eukprot:CAMPEP_0172599642 /NCGR_PEP_ID=MMETSP1068-20121228/19753_1 /TAXON_ID=35684 /ORGANISM="Pseudopedinella elastica, Strain CCMP716" /LENGTH=336 /DNA_ID=CAMNT_0013399955 /DNA_START=27 /DNA_END=1034 /DNA_ORIENTATION=+
MFGNNRPTVFSLGRKARCIAALESNSERHRFIVGTSCLREPNELALIEYNEEEESVYLVRSYIHPKDVSSLAPSPREADLLFTCSGLGDAVLWRAPEAQGVFLEDRDANGASPTSSLESVAELPQGSDAHEIIWRKDDTGDAIVASFGVSGVRLWNIRNSLEDIGKLSHADSMRVSSGAWDPHHPSNIAIVCSCSLQGWDTRILKSTYEIAMAHKYACRSVDYNPNKPGFLVTCGDDRMVKFWDLRSTREPIRTLAGHTHWCTTALYNKFHDQLVLSAGTDASLNLWRCSSISSAPLLELDGEEATRLDAGDCKVRSYDDHEESIYSAAWSASDAW